MPKTPQTTTREVLNKIVRDPQFRSCFEIVQDTKLRCQCCNYIIDCDRARLKERAVSHSKSNSHQKNLNKPMQPSVTSTFRKQESQSSAADELMEALVTADIPLSKLSDEKLNKVLSEKFGKLPCQTKVREKIIPSIFERKIKSARELLQNIPVVFMLDETTDSMGRNVLNILCGRLDGEPLKMMLVRVAFIERTDSTHVSQEFVNIVKELDIKYDDVWLTVTDQAPYMLKCFRELKVLFPTMHHVTCLAHAMHRVCEFIRDEHELVDQFLGKMRVVFTRSKDRSQLWKDVTELPLPPKPCLTRWGTWLEAASFYASNFSKVEQFLQRLPESNKKIKEIKTLVVESEFKQQLISTFNFHELPSFITKLEKHGLAMTAQVEILNNFKAKLGGQTLSKLQKCLQKNPDFSNILNNDGIDFNIKMKYAPLVSVDVERSFSIFKAFFRSNRHSFNESNIEKNLVIICNPDL